MGVGQDAVERHGFEARVGAVAFAVEEGALLGFDEDVDALGGGEGREVEALGDLQHLQHDEAGGVGRGLGDLVAAIGDADRGAALGLHGGEVGLGDQGAALGEAGGQALGEFAAIEGLGAVGGDFLQGAGEGFLDDQVADREIVQRRAEEGGAAGRVHRQAGAVVAGDVVVAMGDAVAVARVADGGLNEARPGQLAVGGVHGGDAGEAARHGDAERAGDLDALGEAFGGCGGRRRAGAVEHLALAVHEHIVEAVAAEAGHHRLHHAERQRHPPRCRLRAECRARPGWRAGGWLRQRRCGP